MDRSKIIEMNIEDFFADTNLEIDGIDSIIKIIIDALENPKYNQTDIKDIDSALFMLQGKLNIIRNNLRIIRNDMKLSSKD